jgi:hypothetical protein
MLTRMRLLKGATGLLYAGPLVAGLSGFGWAMVAPFAAIFVVWLMVLRPEQWPESPDEWLTGEAWLAAFAQALSQVVLVAILFAIGRGLGGLAGVELKFGPIMPFTISLLAVPLARMLWDPTEAAEQGYFLDEEAEAAHSTHAAAEAAKAVIPLLNIPDDAPDSQVADSVSQVMNGGNAGLRLKAVAAALAKPDRSHAALRQALVLWASEPERVAAGTVKDGMAQAFAIADGNPDLLRLYVPRALALISAFPRSVDDFPVPEKLRETVEEPDTNPYSDLPAHLRADLHDGLLALASVVEKTRNAAFSPAAAGSRSEPATQHEPRTA